MRKKITDIPEFDRPREKLQKKGVKALSDVELLSVLIGKGVKGKDVLQIAKEVLKLAEKDINNLTLKNLENIEGIGLAKASQILAAIEFSKRILLKETVKISSAADIVKLAEDLKNKKQEYFLTFTLDGANNLIKKRVVFIGTLNRSLVHPREVFADAITDRAASIIFVHNHPSGSLVPSKEDKLITNRLVEVGNIIGIKVLDHIIISKNGYLSFQAEGLINSIEGT
ncbi:MAG: DNA repair protein RadC [Caldisericaceae bacterium]|nr:DNA repair protein RadC [Caldisericaceae bacterium]